MFALVGEILKFLFSNLMLCTRYRCLLVPIHRWCLRLIQLIVDSMVLMDLETYCRRNKLTVVCFLKNQQHWHWHDSLDSMPVSIRRFLDSFLIPHCCLSVCQLVTYVGCVALIMHLCACFVISWMLFDFWGELTLLALGPLTNIALAVKLDPSFGHNLSNVVIMGGNYGGNSHSLFVRHGFIATD